MLSFHTDTSYRCLIYLVVAGDPFMSISQNANAIVFGEHPLSG